MPPPGMHKSVMLPAFHMVDSGGIKTTNEIKKLKTKKEAAVDCCYFLNHPLYLSMHLLII